MKIRTDFVTNSSSASFILARKGELNQKQKERIVSYIEENMLGEVLLVPGATEEEIAEMLKKSYIDKDYEQQIREALKEGKTVYSGWVSFEDPSYDVAEVYEDIWEILAESGDGNFVAINDDLSY